MRIRFVCLSTVGCMLLGTCLYVGATHVHDYHVMGKELVSVRPGYTHEYISSTITDPITGVETPYTVHVMSCEMYIRGRIPV